MELNGKVKKVFKTVKVTEKYSKREVVITTKDGMYEQDILLHCSNNQTDLLDGIRVGDNVDCKFNLKGREWTNPKDNTVRYFNSLDAWKVEKVDNVNSKPVDETFVDEDSDLPF